MLWVGGWLGYGYWLTNIDRELFVLGDRFAGWVLQTKIDGSVNVSNISALNQWETEKYKY